MITIKTMFELHRVEADVKLRELEKELIVVEKSKKETENYLLENYNKLSIKYEEPELLSGTCILLTPNTKLDTYFNIRLKHYNQVCTTYQNKLQVKVQLEKQCIIKEEFNYIIQRFNTLLYKELVNNAYHFKDIYLGGFCVIVNKNTRPVINWGKSIKNKTRLLANGLVPYTKQGEKEAKDLGLEYKGVAWLEYIENYRLFYDWTLTSPNYCRMPNLANFSFIPYRGEDSPVKALSIRRADYTDEELINHYKQPESC